MEKRIELYILFLKNEKNYSNHTIVSYRNDLMQLLKYLKDDKILKVPSVQYVQFIDRSIMRKYIVYLKKNNYSVRSIARKVSTIRSFFKFLLREGIIKINPTINLITPKI
ncbi:MAG: site-specific integrase, partial [Atribacterota bacterium]|nr:site-specific integrase [Atribacterota bacterium]